MLLIPSESHIARLRQMTSERKSPLEAGSPTWSLAIRREEQTTYLTVWKPRSLLRCGRWSIGEAAHLRIADRREIYTDVAGKVSHTACGGHFLTSRTRHAQARALYLHAWMKTSLSSQTRHRARYTDGLHSRECYSDM